MHLNFRFIEFLANFSLTSVGNFAMTVNANLLTVQTRIGNTNFEIGYLTRCLADLHEQEIILQNHLKELEKLEKPNRKGKGKAVDI